MNFSVEAVLGNYFTVKLVTEFSFWKDFMFTQFLTDINVNIFGNVMWASSWVVVDLFSPSSFHPLNSLLTNPCQQCYSGLLILINYFDYSNTQEKENETDRFGGLS